MRLLRARAQALRERPEGLHQVAVRGANDEPAGDRAFSHVFREAAAGSRFAGREQASLQWSSTTSPFGRAWQSRMIPLPTSLSLSASTLSCSTEPSSRVTLHE